VSAGIIVAFQSAFTLYNRLHETLRDLWRHPTDVALILRAIIQMR
jgi:hypothetical protein